MTGWQKICCYITVTKYAIYFIILSTLTKTDDFGTSAILATTWQGGHVGGQNNRIFFQRIIYMKIGLSSQRREMFLFLTTKHTAMIKVFKSVGVSRKSSFCPTKTGLHTLYYSLVYSYFQYCILVWGLTYPTHLRRLVLLQKRNVRIISKNGSSMLTLIHYLRVLWSLS